MFSSSSILVNNRDTSPVAPPTFPKGERNTKEVDWSTQSIEDFVLGDPLVASPQLCSTSLWESCESTGGGSSLIPTDWSVDEKNTEMTFNTGGLFASSSLGAGGVAQNSDIASTAYEPPPLNNLSLWKSAEDPSGLSFCFPGVLGGAEGGKGGGSGLLPFPLLPSAPSSPQRTCLSKSNININNNSAAPAPSLAAPSPSLHNNKQSLTKQGGGVKKSSARSPSFSSSKAKESQVEGLTHKLQQALGLDWFCTLATALVASQAIPVMGRRKTSTIVAASLLLVVSTLNCQNPKNKLAILDKDVAAASNVGVSTLRDAKTALKKSKLYSTLSSLVLDLFLSLEA